MKQVIETLERECRISQDVIKNNLDKTHPIGRLDDYCKELKIVKFTTDSFKERCSENTSIGEMHTLKDKNVVISLFKLM